MLPLLCVYLCFCMGAGDTPGGNAFDVKLARGLGVYGYNAARITVTQRDGGGDGKVDPTAFTYNAPFLHRWTDQTLHTVLVNATPGKVNVYRIGTANDTISYYLPAEGASVRGVFFGDPCTEPGFVGCIHFNNTLPNSTNMSQRLPLLFNALSDVDFRIVVSLS